MEPAWQKTSFTRRQWLVGSAALVASASLSRVAVAADPIVQIEDVRVISWKPPLYHGWPTLARRKNGELLLVFSGGRETHVCPFGRVEMMRSQDNGVTWRWPQVLMDGPIDDRDAGVLETERGTILVTTFTSLAYEPILKKAEGIAAGQPGAWDPHLLQEWQAVHGRMTAEQRERELGCYMLRSEDGGVTWKGRQRVPVNSPHGPIQLRDGRLLYCGAELWTPQRKVSVCESTDDGVSWQRLAEIPTREGDDYLQYHELHAVEATNGTIICHIRNHNTANKHETLQCESTDGGKTWTTPHSIGVWGYPSHLLRLKGGRLLMSYGHRRAPLGNQVRISDDQGKTWSPALIINGDATSSDMGYPSTVECDDGTLVTVWYEKLADSPLAQLRQARWRLG
ncbi:exo-alpha-sialidase [bacterium]|nr:exo-alpha-sialidase [bacterium]